MRPGRIPCSFGLTFSRSSNPQPTENVPGCTRVRDSAPRLVVRSSAVSGPATLLRVLMSSQKKEEDEPPLTGGWQQKGRKDVSQACKQRMHGKALDCGATVATVTVDGNTACQCGTGQMLMELSIVRL